MGKWASMMSNMAMNCNGNGHNLVRRLDFNHVLDFLKEKEDDPKFCASVLAGLPKEIMQKYFDERRSTNYEPPEFMPEAAELGGIAALKNSQSVAVEDLVFVREEESDEPEPEKTTDVFGKSLKEFK